MSLLKSTLGAVLSPLLAQEAFWVVKLDNGKLLSERDYTVDRREHIGGLRKLDWHLDMVSTDDALRVRELWMICPPSPTSPLGNTAKLPILEHGTAFTFKVATLDAWTSAGRSVQSMVIGRVDDKLTGDCTYFAWDEALRVMSTPMQNSVYQFSSWRPEIGHIGRLNLDGLGLDLR